jgi:hypothetical protein
MDYEITQPSPLIKEEKKYNKFQNFLENLIAIVFWLYILIKLFVYDIDSFLIKNYFPNTQWLIEYKFFVLLFIMVSFWFFTKKNYAVKLAFFIVFFPFVLLFCKVPYMIYQTKSWTIAIAFVNTIISFFSSFKFNFFVFSISSISFFLIFKFKEPTILYFAIAILFITIIIIYINRFLAVFMSSSMYKIHLKIVNFLVKHGDLMTKVDDEIKDLAVLEMNSAQLRKWTNSLQLTVIINKSCFFLSSRLQEYQKSNLNIIFYILNLFVLLFITIFFFGGMNYALYKIDQNSYIIKEGQSFFNFFYYSFNTIFFGSIPEITASSNLSHSLKMLEIIFSFLLITIFTVLIFNIKSKKHSDELGNIIDELTLQGQQIESRIQAQYKMSVNDAIIELERLKSELINFIYFLSKNLNKK